MATILKEYKKELFIVGITLFSIFIPVIPPIILFLILLYFQLKNCSLLINAFIFIAFFRILLGALLIGEYGIKGVGGLSYILGIALLLPYIKKYFHTLSKGLCFFIIICIYFLISCIANGNDQVPMQKWVTFCTDGIVYYFLFSILFLKRKNINFQRIAIFSIAWAFFLLYTVEKTSNLNPPANLFDVGFYRFQVQDFMYDMEFEKGAIFLHYQVFGFFALLGMTLMMMQSFNKTNQRLFTFLCVFLVFLLTIYTGARQFIIINVFLAILYTFWGSKSVKTIFLIFFIGIAVIATGSLDIFNLLFENINESGVIEGSGRLPLVEKAYDDIINYPLLGIGFGHFNLAGTYCFPHNIFLELLSTVGIVGFLFLILVIISYNRDIWSSLFTSKYGKWMYPFIFLLMRACISQPVESNVILFSLIFATPYMKFEK